MEITGTTEWDEIEDRAIWRQFLESRTGKRIIPKALEACPALSGDGDTNSILIRNGEVRGVQIIIQALFALSQPEPKAPPSDSPTAYPDLADDAAWSDGQKTQ